MICPGKNLVVAVVVTLFTNVKIVALLDAKMKVVLAKILNPENVKDVVTTLRRRLDSRHTLNFSKVLDKQV